MRAKRSGVWETLTPVQQTLVHRNEAEEVDDEKQVVESDLAQALQILFGVTAEDIRRALQEGDFTLIRPNVDAPDTPGSQILEARTILNASQFERRLSAIMRGEVPDDLPNDVQATLRDLDSSTRRVIRRGFDVGLQRMEAEGAFNPNDPLIQNAEQRLNRQAVNITDATRRRINEIIRREQSDPSNSVDDIARVLVDEVDDMGALPRDPDRMSRAQRIAATTVQSGFEAGQLHAMDKAGAVGRKWISMRDPRTRSGHLEADAEGQTVRLDEVFRVSPQAGISQEGRERLEYPGDPSGSPSNVISCRCTTLPILDEEVFQDEKQSEPDLSNLPQFA